MNILLVRPRPSPDTIGLQHLMVVEPLELEILGALISPPDRAIIVDLILEREPFTVLLERERPDVVCVTGYITHVEIMKQYCRQAKAANPDVRTVVGGVHCEVCPRDLDDPAVDYRVVRNAVAAFPALIDHIRTGIPLPNGVLRPGETEESHALPEYDFSAPFPDRSLTAKYRKKYFYIFHKPVALLKTAFGCPYRCSFCFCRAITKGRYHPRPVEEVIEEIQQIAEPEIYIVDDDFLVDPARIAHFIDEHHRLKLKKRYLIYGRADFIVRYPDLIRQFRDIGLRTVIVGFESFFNEELDQYHKGVDAHINRKAMAVLNANRIDCYATVIIPPHWTHEHFRESGRQMKDLGIHYVNLQPLTPLPGTEYSGNGQDLLIERSDYARWDLAHVAIRPQNMGIREFYRAILDLYNDIIFQPSVLWGYLQAYSIPQLWAMLSGSRKVRKQYVDKMNAARVLDPKDTV